MYSEPDRGTTFKIYLPREDAAAAPVEDRAPKLEDSIGSETVLVVEDDPNVRKLACQTLRKFGYEVLEPMSVTEAQQLCESRREPIALLVADVVLPQLSGPRLAARLRELHPEMRVLYASGYTDDAVVRHGLLDRSMSFLQKPFTPGALARKVREVLDA